MLTDPDKLNPILKLALSANKVMNIVLRLPISYNNL